MTRSRGSAVTRLGLGLFLGGTLVLGGCATSGMAESGGSEADPTTSANVVAEVVVPSCDVTEAGFSIQSLPPNTKPVHQASQARAVADDAHVGPDEITSVTAVTVTDPVGVKLGLPTTARTMWVIYGDSTFAEPTGDVGDAGMAPRSMWPSAGTISHSITLVDDATLKLGGNFTCH